eukprot:4067523-Pyramimonas_sp.AAC.1
MIGSCGGTMVQHAIHALLQSLRSLWGWGVIYLTAFGPVRHHAWVMSQRPHGCGLGPGDYPLGALLEAAAVPLGGNVLGPLGAC